MKRVISIIFLITISLQAYKIGNSWWYGNGDTRFKSTNIFCDSGKTVVAQYYPLTDRYLYDGKSYVSLSSLANDLCVKHTKHNINKSYHSNFTKVSNGKNIKRTAQNSLVCKTKKDIKTCLSSRVSYDICKQSAELDYRKLGKSNWKKKELEKDCFILNDKKVIYLNSFHQEKLIDGYAKIQDGDLRLFYIKNSNLD